MPVAAGPDVIRNVVLVRLREDHDPELAAELMAGFRHLACPGTLSYTVGGDLGLRPGTWSFAIVADFTDTDAYRAYDLDEEHNRLRSLLRPMAEEIGRVQFEVP